MNPARAMALLGTAYALAGCGATASDQVQAKLQQFAHAVANRDAKAMCTQVLAPTLVDRLTAAGLTCEDAMQTFFGSVSDPTIAVSKVTVKGATASAVVLSGAKGQPSSLDAVHLTNTRHGWRLSSLASPG